jgi:membrane protein DedA with SNARE-associated domain
MHAIQSVLLAHPWAGLLLLALMAFLEYIVPPVPGDSTMLFACFLAATGTLPWTGVISACLGGSVAGASAAYAIGARLGHSYFFLRSAWARHELQRLERAFHRHGTRLLAVNRLLPGVRAVFLYAAGIGRLGWRPVLVYSSLSNAIWVGLIAWGGRSLGATWEQVSVLFRRYVWGVGIVTSLYVIATVARARRRARAGVSPPPSS